MQHITDDFLERYSMGIHPASETGPLEEHLLVCSDCQDRLDARDRFVGAMRAAAAKLRHQEG